MGCVGWEGVQLQGGLLRPWAPIPGTELRAEWHEWSEPRQHRPGCGVCGVSVCAGGAVCLCAVWLREHSLWPCAEGLCPHPGDAVPTMVPQRDAAGSWGNTAWLLCSSLSPRVVPMEQRAVWGGELWWWWGEDGPGVPGSELLCRLSGAVSLPEGVQKSRGHQRAHAQPALGTGSWQQMRGAGNGVEHVGSVFPAAVIVGSTQVLGTHGVTIQGRALGGGCSTALRAWDGAVCPPNPVLPFWERPFGMSSQTPWVGARPAPSLHG